MPFLMVWEILVRKRRERHGPVEDDDLDFALDCPVLCLWIRQRSANALYFNNKAYEALASHTKEVLLAGWTLLSDPFDGPLTTGS
jgi:hypothetical protein